MIKNKDGSYNKFRLLIISLIFIITISITGFYIVENIKLPKIDIPSLTTPTPTPTPTPIPIDPSISLLYNSSNITYNSNTTWNWSYTNFTNFTNTSNWTYPLETISNFTFVVGGGGGQCFETYKYDGGGGGQCFENVGYGGAGGSSANISYAIVAGGGGGGVGYTSVAYINSTPAPQPTQIISSQEVFVNASQNVSQALVQIVNPLGESSWLVYLILIFPMMMMISMMRGGSISILLPIIIGLVAFGYFFNIGTMPLLVIIGIIPMIIIMFSMLSDR